MAIFFLYLQITFITILLTFLLYLILRIGKKTCEPTNWPLIGMLPTIINNLHRAHDKITEVLCECGGTYYLKGPWLSGTDILFTSDPANLQHILNKNFPNYPKGSEFMKKFEILGDGIFSADFEMWELQRRVILSLINHSKFHASLERRVWEKIETGLLPVLEHFSNNADVDLQEVFQRLTFDNICQLVLDYDPGSLRADFPYMPCEKAFSHALQPLMYRHVLPERMWRLQKWLNVGSERKLTESWKAFDDFIYPRIAVMEEKMEKSISGDVYASFRKAYEENNKDDDDDSVVRFSGDLRRFLRDSLLGLLFAGRDTTSTCLTWLFWLIAVNPEAQTKILDELQTELQLKEDKKWRFFSIEESSKLIYLHASLCESLRLFPPLALEYKSPVQPDTLPSGHFVRPNEKLVISFYTVGRNEKLWGKDCKEFKPERWITPRGGIKHEPSYKFPAFNVGPRTCLGKEMSFIQMKMVAATIVYHYRVELVEGHSVTPIDSLMLHARNGLMVRLSKRN